MTLLRQSRTRKTIAHKYSEIYRHKIIRNLKLPMKSLQFGDENGSTPN